MHQDSKRVERPRAAEAEELKHHAVSMQITDPAHSHYEGRGGALLWFSFAIGCHRIAS